MCRKGATHLGHRRAPVPPHGWAHATGPAIPWSYRARPRVRDLAVEEADQVSDATAPPGCTSRSRPGEHRPLQGLPLRAGARGPARHPDLRGRLWLPRPRPGRSRATSSSDLPADLFDGAAPAWWPVPWLMLCGLLVALTIRHLPGHGGPLACPRLPVGGGRRSTGPPGIVLASLATLSLGAVLGPEAPLIAIGGGLAAAHRSPGQEGRHADGGDDHGLGRQLRRGQHAARLAPARRLPHHGGGRYRGRDAQPRRAARPARLRHRRPCLRRPGRLDRAWAPSRWP